MLPRVLLTLLLFTLAGTCARAQTTDDAPQGRNPVARVHRVTYEPVLLLNQFYYGTERISGTALRAVMQDDREAMAELRGERGLLFVAGSLPSAVLTLLALEARNVDSSNSDRLIRTVLITAGVSVVTSYVIIGVVNRKYKRAAAIFNANNFPPPPPPRPALGLEVGLGGNGLGLRANF